MKTCNTVSFVSALPSSSHAESNEAAAQSTHAKVEPVEVKPLGPRVEESAPPCYDHGPERGTRGAWEAAGWHTERGRHRRGREAKRRLPRQLEVEGVRRGDGVGRGGSVGCGVGRTRHGGGGARRGEVQGDGVGRRDQRAHSYTLALHLNDSPHPKRQRRLGSYHARHRARAVTVVRRAEQAAQPTVVHAAILG
eukprot:scaffold25574_cov74-Phaeocystis_antarctica.AAC.2